MTNAFTALNSVLRTAVVGLARFLVAVPINILTIPFGGVVYAAGTLLELVASDAGSEMRMQGLETIQWGWAWWPVEVDVDSKV